jgi:uncharacterized protein YlbG (UPF0298 family)
MGRCQYQNFSFNGNLKSKELKQICFCNTRDEAETLVSNLRKLKHISNIEMKLIKELKDVKD